MPRPFCGLSTPVGPVAGSAASHCDGSKLSFAARASGSKKLDFENFVGSDDISAEPIEEALT